MGRSRLLPGQLGSIGTKPSKKGGWEAWARFGTASGTVRIERSGRTKAIAVKAVQAAGEDRVQKWLEAEHLTREATVPTLDELAQQWFDHMEPPEVHVGHNGDELPPDYRTRVRRQTFDQYKATYRNHVQGALGELKITQIGTRASSDFLHSLVSGGQGLTRARLARVVLKGILDLAARQELIPFNPVNNVAPLPRRTPSPRGLDSPSLKDVRAAVRDWRNQPGTFGPPNDGTLADIVDVMLATGTRIGEVLAIRWSDVDLEAPVPIVRITGTIIEPRKGPKYRQARPKNQHGYREIPLPQFAVDVLSKRRVNSPESNVADAVFWSQGGTYRQPSAVRRSLRSALQAASIQLDFAVSPHVFRKTVATLLAAESGPEAAQSVLGHSSIVVTERSYIATPVRVQDHRSILEALNED